MLLVDSGGQTDPRINLAMEEFLLRETVSEEPLLLFYINEPSVIIGRNQNTFEEIDSDYIDSRGIHVVRRLSGGGAVYHDLGNLNFSFVTPGKEHLHDFAGFIEPVVKTLRSLGVAAEQRGKSDIFVDDRKISGNAQYASENRMFSHGTILFDTDLGEMLRAINPQRVRIESKAVQSVRNYVANVREWLPQDMTIGQLKEALIRGIFGGRSAPTLDLQTSDWQAIQKIAANRYSLWNWNYGRSPQFNVRKSERLPAGMIEAHIDVEAGHIRAIRFHGDFSGIRDVSEVEERLVGLPYERETLTAALDRIELDRYFGPVDSQTLAGLLY
ncbi:MAG TPA: lipoate--protein ligase [Promineifilum sp.]